MLYFLIVSLRSQFTQPLLYAVVPDRSDKGALVLTERDRYPSFRLQLCSFRRALSAMFYGLVLLFSCRHIMPSLIKSQIMTWLVRLTRYTIITNQNIFLYYILSQQYFIKLSKKQIYFYFFILLFW